MNYIVLIVINIILIAISFWAYHYLIKELTKRQMIIVMAIYTITIIIFNIFGIKILTNEINNKYDSLKLKKQIKEVETAIVNSQAKIKNLNNELNSINHQENVNMSKACKDNLEQLMTVKSNALVSLEEQKNQLNNLQNEYKELQAKVSYLIPDFPTGSQFPNYPNGCEITALHLLLKYYKIDVSIEELANNLDKGPAPFNINGVSFGSNPEEVFVGDPRKTHKQGYGVFQKPIIKLANNYKSGMIDYTGHDLNDILKLVKEDIPVQVWASINLQKTDICQSWIDVDSGKKIDWRCHLHSVVIVGYTFDEIIVSDPYVGQIRSFSKREFEKIYNIYGRRAIYYEKN